MQRPAPRRRHGPSPGPGSSTRRRKAPRSGAAGFGGSFERPASSSAAISAPTMLLRSLAERLGGENAWLASAYQMQVAAWWQSSEREMLRALGESNAAAAR
jgi:hypothetical protein